ncbi:MAG: CrcB family protein [Actinomycetota bacterium]
MTTALIALGLIGAAMVGAMVRFGLATRFNGTFPTGTLLTNLAASFALGAVTGLDDAANTIVGIGLLGALSTWSTVANEAAEMARDRQGLQATLYVWATTSSGIVAAWLGLQVADRL